MPCNMIYAINSTCDIYEHNMQQRTSCNVTSEQSHAQITSWGPSTPQCSPSPWALSRTPTSRVMVVTEASCCSTNNNPAHRPEASPREQIIVSHWNKCSLYVCMVKLIILYVVSISIGGGGSLLPGQSLGLCLFSLPTAWLPRPVLTADTEWG